MNDAIAAAPEKGLKRTGWALMALALATPALMGAVGVLSAFQVGELTTKVGFAWLAAAIVVDLLTRKRAATVKAQSRIVAAVMALAVAVVAVFNIYQDTQKVKAAKNELVEEFMRTTVEARTAPSTEPTQEAEAVPEPAAQAAPQTGLSDADRTVAYLNKMKQRAMQFAQDSAALERKFNAIDVTTFLTAQNLTTKAGLDATRKKLNAFGAAVAERDAALANHIKLTEQIIRNSGLPDHEIAAGMRGLNDNKTITQKAYADLSAAQLTSLKATVAILDFARQRLGRITVENGQPMFQTQPELDDYRRLFQVLTEAANAEEAVSTRVQALAQSSMQSIANQLK